MKLDNVNKFLFEKIKLNIIQGKIAGLSSLPTDDEIKKQIDIVLNSSQNGIIGSLSEFIKNETSNSIIYNNNFLTIKDNIEYILGEVYSSLNKTIDIINDSILEKNQVLRELKLLNQDMLDIESGSLHNDGIKYVISDSIADVDKIDVVRSTTQLNLNAGNASLNTIKSDYLGFPHYRNQTVTNFVISEGFSNVLSQKQTPGTSFGSIFNNDNTNRWELIVTTNKPTTVEGYFTLKLSEINSTVDINSINMKLFSTKGVFNDSDIITVSYLSQDQANQTWDIISGAKVNVTGPEVDIKFPTLKTTHIRIIWTKFYPDNNDTLEYMFSISELAVHKTTSVFESTLMSNSLQVTPYQNEQPTIFVAELEVDHSIPTDTNIDYFVAVDEPIQGKVVDINNNVVDSNSELAYKFVPNGIDSNGVPENYYTFASELRDNYSLLGAEAFRFWNPKWQPIAPTKSNTKSIPKQLFFNTSDFDIPIHDLYYTNPLLWGDPSYKGPWPVVPSYGWANDWEGNTGNFPHSGYIWGEDPISTAGVWWGDSIEYPGWWRPSTPTASGTYLNTPITSRPDFIIPVYDSEGKVVTEYSEYFKGLVPIQKHFWKIFKWPSSSQPIAGTVKIGSKSLLLGNEVRSNASVWKWNYKSSMKADDYLIDNIELDSNTNFFTIKLDSDYLNTKSNVRIIRDSIRNVRFLDSSPSDISDFTIEYGREYVRDTNNGLFVGVDSEESLKDARATIIFSDSVINQRRRNGTNIIRISLLLSYEAVEESVASWDGYLLVPETNTSDVNCYINEGSGGVKKVVVQKISDTNFVEETKEIGLVSGDSGESINKFSLFNGLNSVRIYVTTNVVQNDVVDDSLATWKPNDIVYSDYIDETYINGEYVKINATDLSIYKPNTVYTTDYDFDNHDISRGAKVLVTYFTDTTDKTSNETEFFINDVGFEIINGIKNYKFTIKNGDNIYINTWKFNKFTKKTSLTYDSNIASHNENKYLTEVDINVLLHETNIDDDSRFALIEDVDGSKYAVIKTPNIKSFSNSIYNKTHFTRTYMDYLTGRYITYTTGTSGNSNINPVAFAVGDDASIPLSDAPANTLSNVHYNNISTYGKKINVIDPTDSGFLFWDTAENLQSAFTIKYGVAVNNRNCDRIMFMAKLSSTTLDKTPSLNSYSLIINNKIRKS